MFLRCEAEQQTYDERVVALDEREDNVLEMTNEEYRVESPDYGELIIEIVHRFHNKKLLSRIYHLAEYLYLYEDGE